MLMLMAEVGSTENNSSMEEKLQCRSEDGQMQGVEAVGSEWRKMDREAEKWSS